MSKILIKSREQGFTLVEMSIVIIIVGLLIAGVAAGTSLIEQARLNSVVVDFRNNQVAYYTFVSKYNAVPGDMQNASIFWPTGCTTSNISNYCNGNGDGLISGSFGGGEERLALKHMSLAGFLAQGIRPVPDDGGANISVTFMGSKIEGAYYAFQSAGGIMAATWPDKTDQNLLFLAKGEGFYFAGMVPNSGALTAEQAFSLDHKLDDATTSSTGTIIGANTGLVRSQDDGVSATSPCVNAGNANEYNVSGALQTCIFSQVLTN